MDVCCYCRQFDDQTNPRISIESYSIDKVFSYFVRNKIEIISSELIHFELNKIRDLYKKSLVEYLVGKIESYVLINETTVKRGKELEKYGFKPYDALHISISEYSGVDFLLTTDDKVINSYLKNKNRIYCKILNPIDFLKVME